MTSELKPAVFLHIQKTAGTSIQEMAREAYGNDSVISHGDFWEKGLEGLRHVPFVSGHFGFEFASHLMPDRYSFTLLRDPVQRIISLYKFCARRDPEEHPLYQAAQNGFIEFLENNHGNGHWSSVWNNQTWQLASGRGAGLVGVAETFAWDMPPNELLERAKSNLAKLDAVGFQENFDNDIRRIFADLGAPEITVRKSNTSPPVRERLNWRAKKRLNELTQIDRKLYAYAVNRYSAIGRRASIWSQVRRQMGM